MYRDVALSAVTCDTSYRLRMTGTARFLIHGCLRRLVVVCFDFISFPHECRFVHHVCILFFWHAALGAYCTFSAIAPFVLFDLVGSLVTSVSHCSWYYCRLTRRVALLLWLLYLCRISSRFCCYVCMFPRLASYTWRWFRVACYVWCIGRQDTSYSVLIARRMPGVVQLSITWSRTTFLYQVQYKLPSTSIPTICTVVLRRLRARATDLPSYSFAAFFGLCIITLICIWFASTRLPECILAVH